MANLVLCLFMFLHLLDDLENILKKFEFEKTGTKHMLSYVTRSMAAISLASRFLSP